MMADVDLFCVRALVFIVTRVGCEGGMDCGVYGHHEGDLHTSMCFSEEGIHFLKNFDFSR